MPVDSSHSAATHRLISKFSNKAESNALQPGRRNDLQKSVVMRLTNIRDLVWAEIDFWVPQARFVLVSATCGAFDRVRASAGPAVEFLSTGREPVLRPLGVVRIPTRAYLRQIASG